jgi:hypothetical protein
MMDIDLGSSDEMDDHENTRETVGGGEQWRFSIYLT